MNREPLRPALLSLFNREFHTDKQLKTVQRSIWLHFNKMRREQQYEINVLHLISKYRQPVFMPCLLSCHYIIMN